MTGLATLSVGKAYSNKELRGIFKCSSQGGMRRSLATGTLVLVSDHTKNIYHDRWIADEFHYTGMGQQGDQRRDFHQNKTLSESDKNGVTVHLCEVFAPGEYVYMGVVKLAGEPYEEVQSDASGVNRRVWVFPLKLANALSPSLVPLEALEEAARRREKRVRSLSDESVTKSVASFSIHGKVSKRMVSTVVYERNLMVSEFARRKAKGVCQLCGQAAPFHDRNGIPFLEVHHIDWLSRGGRDTIDNTAALCPNCHRRMHVLDLKEDRERLRESVKRGVGEPKGS